MIVVDCSYSKCCTDLGEIIANEYTTCEEKYADIQEYILDGCEDCADSAEDTISTDIPEKDQDVCVRKINQQYEECSENNDWKTIFNPKCKGKVVENPVPVTFDLCNLINKHCDDMMTTARSRTAAQIAMEKMKASMPF